ncbi:MAG: hypothetical protein ACLFV8_14055 [Alphaproteobacteria bacterium]
MADLQCGLTKRQAECLRAIETLTERLGHAPSIREIAREMGNKSPTRVHYLLGLLKERGRVTWIPAKRRSIRVIPDRDAPGADSRTTELLADEDVRAALGAMLENGYSADEIRDAAAVLDDEFDGTGARNG